MPPRSWAPSSSSSSYTAWSVARTRRPCAILDEVILLAVQVNPDGMELVSDWYMRESDPLRRSTQGCRPVPEVCRARQQSGFLHVHPCRDDQHQPGCCFHEWFPQIVYNHHQTGPSGTVLYAPPFRDPPNHNLDPLILTGLDAIGAAMHGRFVSEGKGGRPCGPGVVFDLVERWPAHYALLQEHAGVADRDHR